MTHAEFVAAYAAGKLHVQIDIKLSAKLVSGQMMLPLILLPVFGIAVGLALTGYLISGVLLFIAALVFRFFVRRTSPGFILRRSLEDAAFYQHVIDSGVLTAGRT